MLTDDTGINSGGTSYETVSWKRKIACKGQPVETDAVKGGRTQTCTQTNSLF